MIQSGFIGVRRCAAVVGLGLALPVYAQAPDVSHGANLSPAAIDSVDGNGVDLLTGSFRVQTAALSMASKEDPDLFYFTWSGRQWLPNTPTISMDEDRHVFVSYPGGTIEFFNWQQDAINHNKFTLTQVRPGTGASLVCVHTGPISGQAWLKDCKFTARDGDTVQFYGNEVLSGGYPPGTSTFYEAFGNLLMWPAIMNRSAGEKSLSYGGPGVVGTGWMSYGAIPVNWGDGMRMLTLGKYNETSITFKMQNQATGAERSLTFATSNLNSSDPNNSYVHPKNVVQSVTGPDGTTTQYTFNNDGNLTQISSPGGRVKTIGYDGDHRVTSFAIGTSTWTYSYNFGVNATGPGQTTVTDPQGGKKYVSHDHKYGAVTLVQDELNRQSVYTYDSTDRLATSRPAGAGQTVYHRDTNGNVTQAEEWNVAGSQSRSTYASYPAGCTLPSMLCTKPISITSPEGKVTNYSYSAVGDYPTYGLLTKVKHPAGPDGIQPTDRFLYGSRNILGQDASGNTITIGYAIRLIGTWKCQKLAETSCNGTADAVGESYSVYSGSYMAGTAWNNALPGIVQTRLGDGTVLKESELWYDGIGNVVMIDDTLTSYDDKSYSVFDGARRLTYQIGPDPDGAGPLLRQVTKHSYDLDGLETLTETGTATGITFASGAATGVTGFNITQFKRRTYDPTYGFLVKEETGTP